MVLTATAIAVFVGGSEAAADHTDRTLPQKFPFKEGTIVNVGCWTTFRPLAPMGAFLEHYYANCANQPVRVCPAVDLPSGRTVYSFAYVDLAAYTGLADWRDTAYWHYLQTRTDGIYTTVHC